MFQDQHSYVSLETTRVLSQYKYKYEDFLYTLLGRRFVLANPAEFRGPMRVRASFVSEKMADGEKNTPRIDLWVEFNSAMGLYTIWGEYWNGTSDSPTVQGSPRTGDDEMLSRPQRVFDWLVAVLDGRPEWPIAVQSELEGLMTPAGVIEKILPATEADGETCMCKLEPEYRVPQAYFLSGTDFPGPYGGYTPYAADLDVSQWDSLYATPVGTAVQQVVDNLYGVGEYHVTVDAFGFVLLHNRKPAPSQNVTGTEVHMRSESKSWFAGEILRMAGVDGRERLQDRRLDEKYSGGTIPMLKGSKKEKESFRVNPPTKNSPQKHKDLWAKIYTSSGEGDDAQTARIVASIVSRVGGKSKKKATAPAEESIAARMRALLSEDAED